MGDLFILPLRGLSNGGCHQCPIDASPNGTVSRRLRNAETKRVENDMSRTDTPPQHVSLREVGEHAIIKPSLVHQDSEDQDDVNISEDLRMFLAKNTRLIDQECEKLHAIFGLRTKGDTDDDSTEEEVISDGSGSYEDEHIADDNSLGDMWMELSFADDLPNPRTPRIMIPFPASNRRVIMTLLTKQNHASDSIRSLDFAMDYTLFDHCTFLKVSESPHIGFVCDTSDLFDLSANRSHGSIFELCQPVPDTKLWEVFYGLSDGHSLTCDKTSDGRLPVRTVTIRIRPDVMCGEVMNAVYAAVSSSSSARSGIVHLLRRQGGHLRVVVVMGDDSIKYVYDAQICTRRTAPYDRVLMIRIYHPTTEELAEIESLDANRTTKNKTMRNRNFECLKNPLDLQLREACALVKLIRATEENLRRNKSDMHWQDSAFPNSKRVKSPTSASLFLRSVGTLSTSLDDQKKKDYFQQFPALSAKDWQVIQAATIALNNTWYSLADNLVYSSLDVAVLGETVEPSDLLDLHYCMQLFLMTREGSLQDIDSLLESVENQIEQVENLNSTFWRVIRRKVDWYKLSDVARYFDEDIPPPDDYSLDIVQSLATEKNSLSGILSKKTLDPSSRLHVVESAVRVVQCGYGVHLGSTHNERIESLYNYATTRLTRKESWLRNTYNTLLESYAQNAKAVEEADAFRALALNHCNDGGGVQCERRIESFVFLQFDFDRGTCWVSATHVIIAVRYLFQKQKIVVLSLQELEVRSRIVCGGCIEIIRGDEIHTLRPLGVDARDISGFIVILQHLLNKNCSLKNSEN